MVGFLYSHIRPQRQLLKEDRQVIPILESLSSGYQPKAKDGGTPGVVTIKRFIFTYLVVIPSVYLGIHFSVVILLERDRNQNVEYFRALYAF